MSQGNLLLRVNRKPPAGMTAAAKRHALKTWPEGFWAAAEGRKTFEVCRYEADFREGDLLDLIEWDPSSDRETGRRASFRIGYLLRGEESGIVEGFCVMGLRAV